MPDGNQTLSTTLEERVSYPDETPHATTNTSRPIRRPVLPMAAW